MAGAPVAVSRNGRVNSSLRGCATIWPPITITTPASASSGRPRTSLMAATTIVVMISELVVICDRKSLARSCALFPIWSAPDSA